MRLIVNISVFILVIVFSVTLHSHQVLEEVSGKTPLPRQLIIPKLYDEESIMEHIELVKEIIDIDENKFISTPSEAPDSEPLKIRTAAINGAYYFKNRSDKKQTISFVMPVSRSDFIDFKSMIGNRTIKYFVIEPYKIDRLEIFYRASFPEKAQQILFKNNLAEIPDFDHDLIDLSNLFSKTGNYPRLRSKISGIPDTTSDDQDEIINSIFMELRDTHTGNIGGFPYNGGALKLYTFDVPANTGETVKLSLSYSIIVSEEYSKDFRYSYILKTGKYWKGPIGESVIRIKPGCPEAIKNYEISPKTYMLLDSNIIEFTFKNYEPDFDIYVNYTEPKTKSSE